MSLHALPFRLAHPAHFGALARYSAPLLTLVALLGGASLVACGEEPGAATVGDDDDDNNGAGNACESEFDCAADEICLRGVCRSSGVATTGGTAGTGGPSDTSGASGTTGTTDATGTTDSGEQTDTATDSPADTGGFGTDSGTDNATTGPDTGADTGTGTDTGSVTTCVPGVKACDGIATLRACNAAGTGYDVIETCDVAGGSKCYKNRCVTDCDTAVIQGQSIGCEYIAVDLPNISTTQYQADEQQFAIVVANPDATRPASVTVFNAQGALPQASNVNVPALTSVSINLPRGDFEGTGIEERAYTVRSTRPVVAFQFNPLLNAGAFSTDATLLLPTHALLKQYIVLSSPQTATQSDPATAFVSIAAFDQGATVTVQVTADVQAEGGNIKTIGHANGSTLTRFVGPGEVWQISTVNEKTFGNDSSTVGRDLTGTVVSASAPVAVYAGTECSNFPKNRGTCDHTEEQLLPVAVWGKDYVVVPSKARASGSTYGDYVRVIAAANGTTLSVSGASVPTLPKTTLNAGEFIEFQVTKPFVITGSQPILVGQFMVGCGGTIGGCLYGDPSFTLAAPAEQSLSTQVFLTPDTFDEQWVTVTAPNGTAVTLDGRSVSGFTAIGSTGYSSAYFSISSGSHTLVGTEPLNIQVYGWSSAISYGYLGGLNLQRLNDIDVGLLPD
jgi:hypothetical protein